MITGEDEDVFWLPLALGTADIIFFIVWGVSVRLVQAVGIVSF